MTFTLATITLAVATGELLRARPATRMPGFIALEVVRPCQKTELWHVTCPEGVDRLVKEWALARGISCHYFVQAGERTDVCPTCQSDAGFATDSDDGLNRCKNCGCH